MWPSNNLENKILSGTYWKVQLVCLKLGVMFLQNVSLVCFFRGNNRIQSDPGAFDECRSVMTILTSQGVIEILWISTLVLEGKPGKEISESWRLEFLEKVSANIALSDAEDNTSEQLNGRVVVDW